MGISESVVWQEAVLQADGQLYVAKVYAFLGEDLRPAPATVGERLKRRREALGLSQREFAKKIGVYPSTIQRWELGQRKPGAEHLATPDHLENLINEGRSQS
jgi:hypothetical protein